ncbi:MAG: hypothetical protein WC647_04340 [Desulfomonilaceae bacterium]
MGFTALCEAQGIAPTARTTAFPAPSDILRQSDVIPFSSGMLGAYMPTIPNLELGFQYYFGDKVRSGQVSGDYLLPYNLGNDAVLFGEAHGNYWNFAQKPSGGASNRVDLSIGAGYRKIMSSQLLIGISGFYDTSRLFNNWYSSGGVGLEMAANMGSSDAVDLNANWYGDLFASNSILNAFRNQGSSFDIQAGYSHALFDSALDLRLKAAGYKFDVGNSVYGYMTGADLTTRDGMFTVRYEYGNDKVNGSWNNIGAFVNVGFQMENIIKGESPVTMPEPIFKSPRNLRRMLTQKVKRDWNQQYAPGRAALASAAVSGGCALSRTAAGGDNNFFSPFNEGVVPYSQLTPGAYVTVTFTYTTNYTPPPDRDLSVYVQGDNLSIYVQKDTPNLSVGTHTVTLQLCGSQDVFITNHANPYRVLFEGHRLAGDFTISNIVVCFNQPQTEVCP